MPEPSQEASFELSGDLIVGGLSLGAQQLYGLESAIVKGRPLSEILLTDGGRVDWERHWAAVRAGQSFRQVMLHRSCSGLRVWVHVDLNAWGGGARLLARRATGREILEHQHGKALSEALGRMLAVGGIGLWMDDRVSDEFDWSPKARALHDVPLDSELSPALLFSKIHPDDRGRAAAEIQRGIAEGIPYDGVLRVLQKDGSYRHLHVFGGATYDPEGLPLLSLGGVRDISDEVALRRRVSELEDQLRAAQRGDVVGRLAGGVAHDFNNILTGILGCCEMLADKSTSEIQRHDVAQIRAATLRAADLTRQLLAFGRRQALRRRPVAPSAVLKDVMSLLRRTLPENVELWLDPVDCAGRVLVDVTQLHQVLTNLVVNAAQAMPDGGRIEISAAQVTLADAGEAAADYVRFAVEDSGPGVPDELRARIFEPFFSTKAPGQGSGLGLSVVQGIVEQHQGQIKVRSGVRGGARFEVYLPVTQEPLDATSNAPEREIELPEQPLRVMLVEDEKMVRELTKRILVGAGFRVTEAADAERALVVLDEAMANEDSFDVLLTDVVLPAMSGPEMVRRLRERGWNERVVYMSGYPADFVESRVQLGAHDILVHKPFTAAALIRALRQRSS